MITVNLAHEDSPRCTDCGNTSDIVLDIAGIRFALCEYCADEVRHGIDGVI